MDTNIAVLAIGNEVVDGQITNRNASWLSAKLDQMGATPLFHLSCRDDDTDIKEALHFLEKRCQLIVVTGGLGPTRDDFTRKTLSEWLKRPLKLDQQQWDGIQNKLKSRNLTIRDGHKNQAYIPHGATVLTNRVGVAPGFFIQRSSCFLAALPGPPNEMNIMFEEQLAPLIRESLSPAKDKFLKTWICLGAPESEVAHIAESLLGESFEIGYRLHRPYVELKVWARESQAEELVKRSITLEEKLKPWFVSYSMAEIRINFSKKLNSFDSVFIIDQMTSGLFLDQIAEGPRIENLRYQCFEHNKFRFFAEAEITSILKHMNIGNDPSSFFVSLFPAGEQSVFIGLNNQLEKFELPRKIPVSSRLGQLYSIETCILKILKS